MENIGEKIMQARKTKGMTQDTLAQLVNVSRQTVSHWENGRAMPDVATAAQLSKVLDVNFLADEAAEDAAVQPPEAVPTVQEPVQETQEQTDGRFEIAITDQGPGIPPEEQKRIYRRFYQVDSSHQQEGNGLGLALCKQILDDCGGTIRAENQSPCGCRFIVTLPEKMTGEEAKQEEAHGTGK